MTGTGWAAGLGSATGRFADVLAAGDLTAPVASCPGWTLADLGNHLRSVHLWAAHAVREGDPDGTSEPVPPTDLPEAYRRAADDLLALLEQSPPEAPAWTFAADRTVGFWWRRQTHETVLHLYDALLSQGRSDDWEIAPDLAWDGIDEVATMFYPRQIRLGRTEPLDRRLLLTATDVDRTISLGEGEPVELSGTARELLLTLWKRTPAGDPEVAAALRAAITP